MKSTFSAAGKQSMMTFHVRAGEWCASSMRSTSNRSSGGRGTPSYSGLTPFGVATTTSNPRIASHSSADCTRFLSSNTLGPGRSPARTPIRFSTASAAKSTAAWLRTSLLGVMTSARAERRKNGVSMSTAVLPVPVGMTTSAGSRLTVKCEATA